MSIEEQVIYIHHIQKSLERNIANHEKLRRNDVMCHAGNGYYPCGASKTEIQSDIRLLRRELTILSKMFED